MAPSSSPGAPYVLANDRNAWRHFLDGIESFDGRLLAIEGEVAPVDFEMVRQPNGTISFSHGTAQCTLAQCSPGNPCCNHCSSPAGLATHALITFTLVAPPGSPSYGCKGNECGLTCAPAQGGRVRVTGRLRLNPGRKTPLFLDVEKIEPASGSSP